MVRRIIILVVSLAIVAVAPLLLVRTQFAQEWLKRRIHSALADAGIDGTIGSLEVKPLPLELRVRDLSLQFTAKSSLDVRLKIPTALARPSLLGLARRELRLDELEIDSPHAEVVLSKGSPSTKPVGATSKPKLSVGRFVLTRGELSFHHATEGYGASLSGLNLKYEESPSQHVEWSVDSAAMSAHESVQIGSMRGRGKASIEKGRYRIEDVEWVSGEQTLHFSGEMVPDQDATLEARIRSDLSEWARFYPPIAEVAFAKEGEPLQGRLEADLKLRLPKLDAGALIVDADMRLEEFRWGLAHVPRAEGKFQWEKDSLTLNPLTLIAQNGGAPPAKAVIKGTVKRKSDGMFEAVADIEGENLTSAPLQRWIPLLTDIRRHGPLTAHLDLSGPRPKAGEPWEWKGSVEGRMPFVDLARNGEEISHLREIRLGSSVIFSESEVRLPSAHLQAAGLDLRGNAHLDKTAARVEFSSVEADLAKLSPIMGLPVTGKVQVGGVLTKQESDVRFTGAVHAGGLTVNKREFQSVEGDVRLEGGKWTAERLVIKMPKTTLQAVGEMDVLDTRFRATLDVQDGEFRDVAMLAGVSPEMLEKFSGRSYGQVVISGQFKPSVRIVSNGKIIVEDPVIAGESFEAAGIQWSSSPHPTGESAMPPPPTPAGAERDPTRVTDADIDMKAQVRHKEGTIELKGRIQPDGKMDGEWIVTSFPMDRFWPPEYAEYELRGRLEGRGSFGGTVFEPYFSGQFETRNFILDGENVADSVLWLERTPEGVRILASLMGDEVKLDGFIDPKRDNVFKARVDLANFRVQHLINVFGPMTEFKGYVDGHVDLAGHLLQMNTWTGRVDLRHIEFVDHGLLGTVTAPLVLNLENGFAHLDPYVIETSVGQITAHGEIQLPDRVDLEASGRVGLSILESIFPTIIAQADGLVEMRAKLHGPLDLKGLLLVLDADVTQGRISFREYPHPVEALHAKVEITQNGFTFERMEGLMGGGLVKGQGRIDMDHFYLGEMYLSASTRRAQLRFPSWISSTADSDLVLAGPVRSPLLTGEVKLLTAQVVENLDWRQELVGLVDFRRRGSSVETIDRIPDHGIRHDVHVYGGINVRNNIARGDFLTDVRVVGINQYINLFGEVKGTRGTFDFKGHEFRADRAVVFFNNPVRIDPEVELYGSTVVEDVPQRCLCEFSGGVENVADQGRAQEKVDLNVSFTARGRPLYEEEGAFRLQFYADRCVADNDLYSLIYFNQCFGDAFKSAGAASLEIYTIILNQITREIAQGPLRQFLGLESIEFDPAQSRSGEQFLSLVVTKPVDRGREFCSQDLKWRGVLNVKEYQNGSRIELDCRLFPNLSVDLFGQSSGVQGNKPFQAGAEMKVRFEFW
ncbi:MAG: translocation/assembly module TamB domain-containing protein [Nitrospirae bacterium]|nr:translocation/assembly module TamB domain-containing protein [Nitrospirota bacterium]